MEPNEPAAPQNEDRDPSFFNASMLRAVLCSAVICAVQRLTIVTSKRFNVNVKSIRLSDAFLRFL